MGQIKWNQFNRIATDASGKYVYAIWDRSNGTNSIVQTAFSSDFGVTWINPVAVTGSSIPNLSLDGKEAGVSKIATNASGQYVYAMWERSNGTNFIVQTARSSDFGVTWVNPSTVTGSSIPNLSLDGKGVGGPQITTDASGQNVYAIWGRLSADQTFFFVQTASSSDFGITWVNPSTVTGNSIPNLSIDSVHANDPQITTNASGKYVYAIWYLSSGTNNIQSVNGVFVPKVSFPITMVPKLP
jgi:hypothetical protein